MPKDNQQKYSESCEELRARKDGVFSSDSGDNAFRNFASGFTSSLGIMPPTYRTSRSLKEVEATFQLLNALEKDLKDNRNTMPPKAYDAGTALAKALYQNLNEFGEAYRETVKNGKMINEPLNSMVTKCSAAINTHRIAIESEPSFFNRTRRALNFFVKQFNEIAKDNGWSSRMKPWAVTKTDMHQATSYKTALNGYREMEKEKSNPTKVEHDINLDDPDQNNPNPGGGS